jgi:hypothetical protein
VIEIIFRYLRLQPKFALNFQIYWDEQEEHTGRRLRSSMHELAGLDSGKQYNCSRE